MTIKKTVLSVFAFFLGLSFVGSSLPVAAATVATQSKPTEVKSFGPNGTHWPSVILTPFMYDMTTKNIIYVKASWTEIEKALKGVSAKQANEGTLILVEPGTLKGFGDGSGSTPVLENLGSKDWQKRVTVAPKEGYGTVKWTNGTRITKVYGVAFAGFEVDGISFAGNTRSALAWIKNTGYTSLNGIPGALTHTVEIVELVQPNHYVNNGDTIQAQTSSGDGYKDYYFVGTYHAPRYFEKNYTGGKPHTDTLQFAGTTGKYGNITIRDSAIFGSNNAAIQTGRVDKLKIEHSYIVSGETSLSRYPHLATGSTEATKNAFNGSGSNFEIKDSTIIGGIALNTASFGAGGISGPKQPWLKVTNTKIDRTLSGDVNKPQNGSWTVDAKLNASNSGMPPNPTDAYLKSIWSKKPNGTTPTPDPITPTDPVDPEPEEPEESADSGWKIGAKVETTNKINVRTEGLISASTLIGTNNKGIKGIIVAGPAYKGNVTWWKINYDSGFDGWSGQDNLKLSSGSVVVSPEPKEPQEPTRPINPPVAGYIFKKSLQIGSKHAEVKLIQQFLNSNGFKVASGSSEGAPGYESETYNQATFDAVKAFQQAFPKKINPQSGRVGTQTRAFLNDIFSGKDTSRTWVLK